MTEVSAPTPKDVLKKETSAYLATSEGGSPRVRPVTVVRTEGALFVLTGSHSNKVKQIRDDSRVEVLTMVEHSGNRGYLRISGEAHIVADAATKEKVAEVTTYFKNYWNDANDPNYTLIRIKPVRAAFMAPGNSEESVIDDLSLE